MRSAGYIQPHMTKTMSTKTLRTIHEGHEYVLEEKGRGRMGTTVILFHHEGIILTGDLKPGRRGVISDIGYGLEWFAKDFKGSGEYLCSKFLEKTWQNEVARQDVWRLHQEAIEESKEWGDDSLMLYASKWKRMHGEWDDFWTETHVFEHAVEIEQDAWEYHLGWDYNLADAGWLTSIQIQFSELYAKRLEVVR